MFTTLLSALSLVLGIFEKIKPIGELFGAVGSSPLGAVTMNFKIALIAIVLTASFGGGYRLRWIQDDARKAHALESQRQQYVTMVGKFNKRARDSLTAQRAIDAKYAALRTKYDAIKGNLPDCRIDADALRLWNGGSN